MFYGGTNKAYNMKSRSQLQKLLTTQFAVRGQIMRGSRQRAPKNGGRGERGARESLSTSICEGEGYSA